MLLLNLQKFTKPQNIFPTSSTVIQSFIYISSPNSTLNNLKNHNDNAFNEATIAEINFFVEKATKKIIQRVCL